MNAVNPVNPPDEMRPSVKDRIYEKWDFLCSCSSIFGLTRFHYQTNPFMMFIWLVSHMGFIAVGFYMVGSACVDFVTYPVVTNVETLLETPVTFPAVTICSIGLNDSVVNKKKSYFGTKKDTFENLNIQLETFVGDRTFEENLVSNEKQINCLRFNGLGTGDSSSLRDVTGPEVKKNTFYIQLDLDRSLFQVDADTADYYSDYNYQFYEEEVITEPVTIPSKRDATISSLISINPFAMVYITHNNLNTFGNETPRYVYLGKSYDFYLNRRVLEEKLPPPYNTCLNTSYDYHEENCLEECIQNKVADQYGCSLTSYYANNSLPKCQEQSTTRNSTDGEDGFRDLFNVDCKTQCVEECFDSSYPYNVLESDPPGNSTLNIKILFMDIKYTYITQIPKSSGFDLFGFIGGTLGMVCGFQLATFVEFLDFLFEVVSVVLDERKKRKLEKTQVHVAIS